MPLPDLLRSWIRAGFAGLALTGICAGEEPPGERPRPPLLSAVVQPADASAGPSAVTAPRTSSPSAFAPRAEANAGSPPAASTGLDPIPGLDPERFFRNPPESHGRSRPNDLPRRRPTLLDRPLDAPSPRPSPAPEPGAFLPWLTAIDPPIGFTGPTSVLPSEGQTDPHFVPMEDAWRRGFPAWDRYGQGHPFQSDYPYMPGTLWDPFNQNVIKGDYPIIGQHLFMDITASVLSFQEYRQIPTATTPFESTSGPNQANFFGRPNQYFTTNYFSLAFDFFHGDAAFKPFDWKVHIVPVFNVNNLSVQELGIVSPNVLQGTIRTREFWALQEVFLESKLADVSPDYDFVSMRIGTQPFNNDFRGFLFFDVNRGVRFFGTRNANRDQWNIAYFRQWEKDTNSQLNTFNDRRQNLVFANYYRQDFLFPGYTAQVSVVYNNDPKGIKYDKNGFLVRPDPVGVAHPHEIDVAYLGWAGDGHIGRFNLTHQFYWALGRDSLNPIANRAQTINGQMFAIEASYDRDWARFRASFFWSSGDHNPNNAHATGFDTILDGPNFAGGPFSYWNRQQIPLFGVNLVQRLSLIPDLRSSKFQGQANFVNPGLLLPTLGVDFDLTPRLKMVTNANVLWFDSTASLQQFLFQGAINRFIGTDVSCGFEYRPLLSENVAFVLGFSGLFTGTGFREIYDNYNNHGATFLIGSFAAINLNF